VFVGNRLTAVNAVKVARETPKTITLQFECEMLTEWLTDSPILWPSYLSSVSVHHDVCPLWSTHSDCRWPSTHQADTWEPSEIW
jgi:hypothetical protein